MVRHQRGGILPFLIPLGIAAAKAIAAAAVSGAAGYGVKKRIGCCHAEET